MSELKPFKAYFEYSFNDEIKTLYRDDLIEIFLVRVAEPNGKVNVAKFLTAYMTGSAIPIFKKERKIPFDFHTRHSISPDTINKEELNSIISFKVKSEEVEVIQILKNDITFVVKEGTVKTVKLDKSINLVRV